MRWRRVPLVVLALAAARAAAQDAEDPLAPVLEQLASTEPKARAAAVRELGRVTGAPLRGRATAALRGALRDPDEGVRVAAAVLLPEAASIDVLVAALGSPDWYTRWRACVALGAAGPRADAAVPVLLNAALDAGVDLAWEASIALARVAPADPAVQDALARLVGSDAIVDRGLLLDVLEKESRLDLVREWLAAELVSNGHDLRERAGSLLVACGAPAVPLLVRACADPEPRVRVLAIDALARLKAVRETERVRAALADPDPGVRRAALHAVVALGIRNAVPDVARLLDGADDREAQLLALKVLADLAVPAPEAAPAVVRRLGTRALFPAAFAALEAVAKDVAECIRPASERPWSPGLAPSRRCEVHLRLPGGARRGTSVIMLLATLEDNRHGADLAAALREVLHPDRDEVLAKMLAASSAAVRRDAVLVLAHLAHDRDAARRAIAPLRSDPDLRVAEAAKRALEILDAR